jgi:hypothetical protein
MLFRHEPKAKAKASRGKAQPIASTISSDGRVTSATVFAVDGYPTGLEGEPPIATSKGWGNMTWTRWRSFGGD